MSVKTSTIMYASLGTVVTGCMAYAAYFDYRRRNDPEFRKALRREARREAKAAKEQAKADDNRERQQIRDMVDEAIAEGLPHPNSPEAEATFMEFVQQADNLQRSTSTHKECALYYFKAMKVYHSEQDLMRLYDQSVPKPVLDILAQMVAYDRAVRGSSSSGSSAVGVE